jgi:type III pantothenate kinase
MNAAIDAGNTRIKVGLFENGSLANVIVFASDPVQNFYSHLASLHFENCIVSSVVPLPAHIISYLQMKSDMMHILDKTSKIPVTNKYKTPETIGNDRLALAVAGAAKYPGKDVLIISAGTCITYNFVTAKGAFTGGAISPGLQMRLRAMHEYTAELPLIAIEAEPALIENDSHGSMASGVVNGIKFEIEGFVNEIKKSYKNCMVILSGGDSRYLAGKLSIETDIQPDLALEGLNLILKFNAPEKN